jgi:hypothetical protein
MALFNCQCMDDAFAGKLPPVYTCPLCKNVWRDGARAPYYPEAKEEKKVYDDHFLGGHA